MGWLEFILSFLLFNSGKTDAEVLPPAQVLSLIQAATENWWRSELVWMQRNENKFNAAWKNEWFQTAAGANSVSFAGNKPNEKKAMKPGSSLISIWIAANSNEMKSNQLKSLIILVLSLKASHSNLSAKFELLSAAAFGAFFFSFQSLRGNLHWCRNANCSSLRPKSHSLRL